MGIESVGRITKYSLADGIAEQLRQSILQGKLKQDTRLYEIELAEQLGVSRGPLREALRILEGEGFVISIPGRGCYVSSLSERTVAELYSIRILLEQEAARQVVKKSTPDQIESLEQILQNMVYAAKQGDLDRVIQLDMNFHQRIWEITDNELLQQILNSLISKIQVYLAVQTSLYEDLATGIADHEDILECLKNKDGEAAANIIRQHLEKAASVLINQAHKQERKNA